MQPNKLQNLISQFSKAEQKQVQKFVESPFFNTRGDLISLYNYCVSTPGADKTAIWRHLFTDAPFDDQKLRLLMSYLLKLIEQYIVWREISADIFNLQFNLAAGYRKMGMPDAFSRTLGALDRAIEAQNLRDVSYYQMKHRLNREAYSTSTVLNPTNPAPLIQLTESADTAYWALRLRLICQSMAQSAVYASGFSPQEADRMTEFAETLPCSQAPVVSIYLGCYRMLRNTEHEQHFTYFKSRLLDTRDLIAAEEMQGLYLFGINYCIRKINTGRTSYNREVFDLYQAGLEQGILFENDVLSRFTYHNIVASGLYCGELEWVNQFIHQYKNALERSYRESSFSFNLARLEYARRRYDSVLTLLQHANYRDPLLNLAAKTLLLKVWTELGEYEPLQSHLEAMQGYIRRKKVIGYHKTNYLNIVKLTQKVIKARLSSRADRLKLQAEIEAEPILSERDWLLGRLLNH